MPSTSPYCPRGQLSHSATPASPVYVPGAQSKQSGEFGPTLEVPAGHGAQKLDSPGNKILEPSPHLPPPHVQQTRLAVSGPAPARRRLRTASHVGLQDSWRSQ
eukprot:CAMPEP_0178373524 /NCGR_PEP_ID=MMETSP0689_2-20121128/1906_1 /TAXON_ID=160604 /ORGANISM="Amphidinium massartii, Strain CS-259" /LENGTH=102 /DNA_ID=CAMNT_0019993467 /DNA_START=179 /DNA_END=484 /DNA_ORIENTATION=-